MPQLGESVTEGTVTRWLKNVGDTVAMDEPLLEVSTDKVDTEIPSPAAGVLLEIKAVEDDVVEVGGELAVVGEASEAAPGAPAPAAPAPEAAAPAAAAPTPEPVSPEPVTAAPAAAAPMPAPSTTGPAPSVAAPSVAASSGPTAPASSGDTTPVTLPALGESVTEGTVTRWLKAVGDPVAVDEPLLEVSTDKVDTEIPSPVAGVLTEISVAEDETVEVGATLGLVGAAGGAAPTAGTPTPAAPTTADVPTAVPTQAAATQAAATQPAAAQPAAAPAPGTLPYASPIVRKLARESGVDISQVTASGAEGRISKDDVRAATGAAAAPPASSTPSAPAPSAPTPSAPTAASAPTAVPTTRAVPARSADDGDRGRTEQLTRLRRVIAERMVESLHISAQLTTVVEVDVTRIANLRNRAKAAFLAREGISLSFLPFFARATLEALKLFPAVNASVDSAAQTVTYYDSTHLGIAVDTDRGLLVPVIRDAGDLTLSGLARRIADLAERTRTNKVGPDELSGGTFTLTNTGSRGALFDTPIINQPQVGILGTGAVVKRAIVVPEPDGEDAIAIRSMAYFALTYDHRIVDGADAARFLGAVKSRLEAADFESELGL